MKYFLFVFGVLLCNATIFAKDCSNAIIASSEAVTQAEDVLEAGKLNTMKSGAKKALTALNQTVKFANECGCDEALSYAKNGQQSAKLASKATSLESVIEYLEQAISDADNARFAAEECTGK